MHSERFERTIRVTHHAQGRMTERDVDEALLLDLLETGTLKHKDARRAWIFKHYPSRDDNLLCAAVLLDAAVIVKTVMHHFTTE